MRIAIGEMILYKGNSDLTLGIAAAFKNHCEGKITRSEGFPIIVRYVLEENKYIIIDGYHRLVKGLLEGKTEFECCLEESDALKHLGWIPPKSHRFIIPETKRKTKMKITKAQLKEIIKEEMGKVMESGEDGIPRDYAMEPWPSPKGGAEDVAARKCWHETKHIPEEEFVAAFNMCMQDTLSAESSVGDSAGALQEGIENLTPENLRMALQALGQLALPAGILAAASVALTNAVHGKPNAEQEKADLYADAEQAVKDRL